MTEGRNPLAVTLTALAFGSVLAPYCFFRALMHMEMPLRAYVLSALVVCTCILFVRFIGPTKLENSGTRKAGGVRLLTNALTAIAFLYSLLVLFALSSFGGMTGGLMWFYALEALGIGAVLALGPLLLLRPSAFERVVTLRLSPPWKFAAYGFILFLVVLACVEALQFYRVQHPIY